MNYAITRVIDNTDMASLKERTANTLLSEGFGVHTEISMQATLNKKLNKDHLPHVILGACRSLLCRSGDHVRAVDQHDASVLRDHSATAQRAGRIGL